MLIGVSTLKSNFLSFWKYLIFDRFTPKYLQVQNRIDEEQLQDKGLNMAKIECTTDKEGNFIIGFI